MANGRLQWALRRYTAAQQAPLYRRKVMKMLSRAEASVTEEIQRQFPQLQQIRELAGDGGLQGMAISVFDHWLEDESEWHLLDCYEGAERERRNRLFDQHWSALYDLTPIYTVRYRGRWPRPSSNWPPKRACTASPSSPKTWGQVGQSAGVRSGKCTSSNVADAVWQ